MRRRGRRPLETPAAVRFGQINVQLAKIRGGIPDDPRLKPPAAEFTLPLLLPLPDHSLLLLKSGEAAGPRPSSRCRPRCCGC